MLSVTIWSHAFRTIRSVHLAQLYTFLFNVRMCRVYSCNLCTELIGLSNFRHFGVMEIHQLANMLRVCSAPMS